MCLVDVALDEDAGGPELDDDARAWLLDRLDRLDHDDLGEGRGIGEVESLCPSGEALSVEVMALAEGLQAQTAAAPEGDDLCGVGLPPTTLGEDGR